MIQAYWRPKDKVEECHLDALKTKKEVWVDCYNPTHKELEEISSATGISVPEFKERILDYERPTIIEADNYSLLIFGAPIHKNGISEVTSFDIFVCNDKNIITIRTEDIPAITKFKQDILSKNATHLESTSKMTYEMLNIITSSYFDYIENFQESADKIEAMIFQHPKKEAIHETFKLRKSLLFFQKALAANKEVLTAIESDRLSRLAKNGRKNLQNLREDTLQLIDLGDNMRNVLSTILDLYNSAVSNQSNKTIKRLTVVASYVMIPTLIASIYGMNFKVLPELEWTLGYPFALFLMVSSIVATYFYFKLTKLL